MAEGKWNRITNSHSFPLPKFKYMGQRGLGRPDCPEKISGTGIYGRDVYLPGMLYAKALVSPYANATIKSLDTTKAEAYPGVRCVLRYDDAEWGDYLNTASMSGNMNMARLPGVADREGQEVGVIIAADTEQICNEALKLVEVEWEELPFLVYWDDAPEDKVVSEGVRGEQGDVSQGLIACL